MLFSQTPVVSGGGISVFLPFILIGVIFYFLIIRPQSKQRKNHDAMLTDLKKGDKILTRGGLYGTIINFQGKNNHIVVINAGTNMKINIARSYIVSLADNNEAKLPEK